MSLARLAFADHVLSIIGLSLSTMWRFIRLRKRISVLAARSISPPSKRRSPV